MSKYIFADGFQEILDKYIFSFLENEQDVLTGKKHIFDEVYKPLLDKQGVSFVNMAVGGERPVQVIYSDTDKFRFWDAHKKLDVLNTELEAGCDSFVLCKTAADIDYAIENNKIAILATLAGGYPLEGKPNLNLLSSLRSLYRMGLRCLQLTGNGRNRLADGCAQNRTRGKLTGFGVQVVKEAERLGMVLDTSQLSDYGFYDVLEQTNNLVIDSHTGCYDICPHPRNISKERIEAIASRGGVVCISFRAALLVGADEEKATVEDLLKHIDYAVKVAGIDHVGLGPDYGSFQTPVDRKSVIGIGNLGPHFCEMNYQTPFSSQKYPGWVDGIWYGIREDDFVEGPNCRENYPMLRDILLNHGYSEEDCAKIMGLNIINAYKKVIK
ncbi:MAG: membrane dipeptidase [Clostridium sp.]|uniref:dipeptidase n=1 Tax=Clostridium sp. TaxID=1506 RepID=UPI002FC63A47